MMVLMNNDDAASILDVLGLVKKQSVVNTGKRDNSTDDGVDE